MPFPNYSLSECESEIQSIDAQIKSLRLQATSWSVGAKSFNFNGKIAELQGQRAEWYARWKSLGGVEYPERSGNALQGPRLIP